MKYDFVLFEHLYNVQNHYKDLSNLAILLKTAGYKVAIADAFKEADLCKVDGIPHISLDINCPKEFKTPRAYEPKKSALKKFCDRIQKDIYIYKVIKQLNNVASNIYIGSLTPATYTLFVKAFNANTVYYMWALRSSYLLKWKKPNLGGLSIISLFLFRNVRKYQNLRLIVSNQLIKKEFIEKVGIEHTRLLQRPERFIVERNNIELQKKYNKTLNLLFIGTLRPEKNVEFCIAALNRLNNPNIYYTIAGRCKTDEVYNKKIEKLIEGMHNVYRIDRYIPEEEYNRLINECDFLILCDKTQASCASNGTMSEALLMGKPIIAPDINPFKYEVETYRVGYLYKYGDIDSLCNILLKAQDMGIEQFQEKLSSYQNMYILDKVADDLKKQIKSNMVCGI